MLSWRKDNADSNAKVGDAATPAASAGTSSTSKGAVSGAPGSENATSPARLGDMLVREGAVSVGQLEEALSKQRESGKFLGQVLVEMNFITQATLVSILVKQCKIPHISLVDYDVSEELFQLVPKELCLKYNLLPIDKLGRILTLAMVDPLDLDALEQVRKTCPDIKIKPILCDWNHFDSVAKRIFQTPQQQNAQEVTAGSFGLSEKKPMAKAKPFEDPSQTAVDATVDALVKEAATATAKPAAPPRQKQEVPVPQLEAAARPRPAAPAAVPAPSAAVPAPAISAEAVGAQVSESVRSVLMEALQPLVAAGSRPQPEGVDSKVIASELNAGLRNAMQEVLAPILAEQQKLAERSATAQPVPDPGQWAGQISQELRNSMLTGFESLLKAQRDVAAGTTPSVKPDELVHMLQASVERPLAEFAQGIRQALLERPQADPSPQTPDISMLIGESVRSAVAAQESRFLQVAESMVQATQAAEATLRAIQEERSRAVDDAKAAGSTIANLEVFPGTGGEELSAGQLSDAGALDSLGLGMEADERVREAIDSDRLLSGYTFKEFIVGPTNTFTLKAARALGEKLARDFNPLYVCGEEGLGKTHLLNAVGNAVLARNPDLRVAYVSTSHFAGAFAKALKHDELSEFRDRFCRWDVLLIDDIQFLAGRMEAQEELFHIFNALVHEGRIVVIAGDRTPDKLPDFQKGLTSRFSSGIVSKLRPPEMEVRLAILKRYAETHRVAVPEEILTLVATRIATDIRRMRGALRKVIAYAKLVEQEITREMANEVLDSLGAEEAA